MFYLIIASFLGFTSQAQVSGFAKDAQGVPIKVLPLACWPQKDSAIIKLALTKDNGAYIFSNIKDGKYLVKAGMVEYQTAYSAIVEVSGSGVTVTELTLTKMPGNLKGVVVTDQKLMLEVQADKMIVTVEGTTNSVGSDGLELLRKSPGVLIDKDDNISLSDKNGVQIYIDGRPSLLGGQDLSSYLKSLNSW